MAAPTALVLARARAPLEELAWVLQENGLSIVAVADLDSEPDLTHSITRAIRLAEVVIVVWDSPRLPRAVMFEAGVAAGLGAPMILLDARRASTARDDLAVETLFTVPRLNARLDQPEELREGIRAAIDVAADYGGQSLSAPWAKYPVKTELAADLGGLDRRVLGALDQLAPTRVSARRQAMEVPDWRVWIERLGPAFNPVFVEISGRRPALKRKHEQLFAALEAGNGHLALLVLAEDSAPKLQVRRDMAICQVSLATLEESPGEVMDLLRNARNRLLHGPA